MSGGQWTSAQEGATTLPSPPRPRESLEYRLMLTGGSYENGQIFQAMDLWRDVGAVRPTPLEARRKLGRSICNLQLAVAGGPSSMVGS